MTNGIAGDRLLSFIERVERLNGEKADLTADIREIYDEAKGVGFDVKTMREIVKLRKMDDADRRQAEEMLDIYKGALGMEGTPLGDFAAKVKSGEAKVTAGKGRKAA